MTPPYVKPSRLLPLLALLAAFPPMTTDMYLPALPTLQAQWGVSLSTINLTLVLFFVFFSGFLLIYGPISDSHGRRPLLLIGIGIYVAASILCALSANVGQLIGARILQAAGAASASALSMAIAKDLFAAKAREQILAHLGVIVALAPMISPIVGGIVLEWLGWQWVFVIQAAMGGIAACGVLRMTEPLQTRAAASFWDVFGRYRRLLKNHRYMALNFLTALSMFPMFAFIAGSPTIYISHFQMSEQAFGYFFGTNALALMAGAFVCSRFTRRFAGWPLMMTGYSGLLLGGTALWAVGNNGPMHFAAAMFVITFSVGMTRPMSNNLVLEQVDRDVGAASSLLVFLVFVAGALAMGLISNNWQNHIRVIAILAIGSGAVILVGFQLISHFWKSALAAVL